MRRKVHKVMVLTNEEIPARAKVILLVKAHILS
jgi:hypothetical protein